MAREPRASSDDAAERTGVLPEETCSHFASEESKYFKQSMADCVLPEQRLQHLRRQGSNLHKRAIQISSVRNTNFKSSTVNCFFTNPSPALKSRFQFNNKFVKQIRDRTNDSKAMTTRKLLYKTALSQR
jgi:hypothetical protein